MSTSSLGPPRSLFSCQNISWREVAEKKNIRKLLVKQKQTEPLMLIQRFQPNHCEVFFSHFRHYIQSNAGTALLVVLLALQDQTSAESREAEARSAFDGMATAKRSWELSLAFHWQGVVGAIVFGVLHNRIGLVYLVSLLQLQDWHVVVLVVCGDEASTKVRSLHWQRRLKQKHPGNHWSASVGLVLDCWTKRQERDKRNIIAAFRISNSGT